MAALTFKYNREMRRLMEGRWADQLCTNIGKELLRETVGSSGIATKKISKKQGQWQRLSKSTLRDKRKKDSRIFVSSGKVERALKKPANEGRLRRWHTSPGNPVQRKRYRYSADGVWAVCVVTPEAMNFAVGFGGRMTHSKSLMKARETLAVGKNVNLAGLSGSRKISAIRKAVSVDEAVTAMKAAGAGRKFTRTNLSYGSVVQYGAFKGVQANRGGKSYTATQAAKGISARELKKGEYSVKRTAGRPLMPFEASDIPMINRAMQRGLETTLKELSGK